MLISVLSMRYKVNIILALMLFVLNMIIMLLFPEEMDSNMELIYLHLCCISAGYSIIIWVMCIKRNIDIFEPYFFFTILHIMLYLIAPFHSIYINDINHKVGTYVFDGCIQASWLAFIVYSLITVVYENYKEKVKKIEFNIKFNSSKALKLSNYMWIVGYLFTILYLAMRGMSLTYILTLSGTGSFIDELVGNSSYAFFSVIANLSFASWLIRFYLKPKSMLTWVMFILTLNSLILRGFRIFVIILILSPIILYCLRTKKRPSLAAILLFLISLLVMIGFVGWARGALRTNILLEFNNFSINDITYAFWGNFDIYKTYYALVNTFPENHPYTMGRQMFLYTIVMLIPRFIWPSKPEPPVREVLQYSLNDYAVKGGSAYPAIGEWFHEFGPLGCIIISVIFGILIKKLFYLSRSNSLTNNCIFSIILPSLVQILIRGYTPSNFWMIIFLILPIILVKKFCGDKVLS